MLFSRRTLLASLGLTLPVAAAEAATRRKKIAHVKKPTAIRHARASRIRRNAAAVPAQS